MASIVFNIDRLQFPGPEKEETADGRENRCLSSYLSRIRAKLPNFILPSVDHADVPKEYDVGDYKVFIVLRDFLQPDSTMTIANAVDCIVQINPEGKGTVAVTSVVFELAEQIPYQHPSHQKLARLMWRLGRSDRLQGTRAKVYRAPPKNHANFVPSNVGLRIHLLTSSTRRSVKTCLIAGQTPTSQMTASLRVALSTFRLSKPI